MNKIYYIPHVLVIQKEIQCNPKVFKIYIFCPSVKTELFPYEQLILESKVVGNIKTNIVQF